MPLSRYFWKLGSDEGGYLDVVDDDELLLELGKLFEERLSDEYDIEE